MTTNHKRLFISHAFEDKEDIARPLAEALVRVGFSVWYDEYSLQLGDSLKTKIDEGLSSSHFGIVILSPAFFSKQWPKEELDGLVALEVARKEKVILPIWHNLSFEEVARYSPTLAGKLGIKSTEGIDKIISMIVRSINNAMFFRRRNDLDFLNVRLISASVNADIRFEKVPEVSWEEFGQQLLEELRRLDRSRQDPEA